MAKSRVSMRGALGSALIVAALGCAGGQEHAVDQSAAITESAPEPVGEAPQCVDDKDQPVSCLADSDCCAGFVCGKDPELNPRASYCIYGG